MRYIKAYEDKNLELVKELSLKYKIDEKIVEYILNLGYNTQQKFEDYINHKEVFYSPFLLSGMEQAVNRIRKAISDKESILIFGDYDVDGIGSTAILVLYFRSIGIDVNYYLPSRYDDGYGLSIDTANKILDQFNPNLIITVDCGISCHKEVEYIKSKGVDIIITDHHEIPEILPDTITIDPKLPNQKYPFRELCGAGVALKLVNALSDLETCKKYYTICAISTISDLVELTDENRFIVHYGLQRFNQYCPKGIKYLLKTQAINNPTATDISFKLTPKLNSAGRMGDASISLQLYLTDNESKIKDICDLLNEINIKRQNSCNAIYNQCFKKINQKNKIILVKDEDWESGVLGIVAAKLVQEYQRPAIVLTLDKRTNRYVGSARGPSNYNIFEILNSCSEFLATYGGHSMAGGLTLDRDKYDKFEAFIIDYVNNLEVQKITNYYDFKVTENEITEEFVNNLSYLEPCGVGNKKPKILLDAQNRKVSIMNKHNEHLTVSLVHLNGVGFGMSKHYPLLLSPSNIDLLVEPYIDTYNNRKNIKFYLQDISCNEFRYDEDYRNGCLIKNLFYDDSEVFQDSVISGACLYISYDGAFDIDDYDVVDYVRLSHSTNAKTMLVCPNTFLGFEAFDNIIFTEKVPSGLLKKLKQLYPNINVIQGSADLKIDTLYLNFEKNTFGVVFNLIKNLEKSFKDDYTYYSNIIKSRVTYSQFVFCYKVLEEIGVLKVIDEIDTFKILTTGVKSDLMKSRVYCELMSQREK